MPVGSEDIGETAAALTDYNLQVIRVYIDHPDFRNPDQHPELPYGGVNSAINRMSHSLMGVTFNYGNIPPVQFPASITSQCTADSQHNEEMILTAACDALNNDGWIYGGGRGFMMQLPLTTGGNEFNGCLLGTGHGTKANANVQYWCGANANSAVVYNIIGDSCPYPATEGAHPPCADYHDTLFTTHEVLHTFPSLIAKPDISGHEGSIYCSNGSAGPWSCVPSVNPSCTCVDQMSGERSHLGISNQIDTLAHWSSAEMNVDWQMRAGWFSLNQKHQGPPNTTEFGLTLLAADSAAGTGIKEIVLPLPMAGPSAVPRFIFLEFRGNNWIGGCSPGNWGAPPCGTVNVPGVYAWLAEGTGATIRYWALRRTNNPNSTIMGDAQPLPVTSTTWWLETNYALVRVSAVNGMTSATVTVRYNQ